ncbi:hypothetical protein ABGI61_00165 [Rheinheimera sp. FR7-31]|uniref:hypothetical protein n=1 Tax=Rheinheimera fenheensis TaxID=3152295 RepID=UPI00325E6DC9
MVNLGTEENRIIGCSIFSDRSKLAELTISGNGKCTPDRVPEVVETNYLLLNLASTPNLSVNDIKLCLFFFHFVANEDERTKIDNVYSLTNKDVKLRSIGKDYSLFIYNVDEDITEEYKMPFVSLHNRLRKANIHIPLHSLRSSLENLHELGFITITEISSEAAEFETEEYVWTDCMLVKVNYFMMFTRQTQRWKLSG